MMDRHVKEIRRFLALRGWRRYGSWWYKPLPQWDRPALGQEIFGIEQESPAETAVIDYSPRGVG